MEKTICGHCGKRSLIYHLQGCNYCSVCKRTTTPDSNSQVYVVSNEAAHETEFVSRVSFHTESNRLALAMASGM